MTTKDKVARRKLSLLELAAEMSNVSKAFRIMGYSRQQFYEIRRNYQTYGADGLIDRLPGARGPHPNRVSAEVETAILAHALDHPTHGALRVAQDAVAEGRARLFRRGTWRVVAPQAFDKAGAAASAGEDHRRAQDRAHGRPDPAPGALQPRVPRTPHPDPAHRRRGTTSACIACIARSGCTCHGERRVECRSGCGSRWWPRRYCIRPGPSTSCARRSTTGAASGG